MAGSLRSRHHPPPAAATRATWIRNSSCGLCAQLLLRIQNASQISVAASIPSSSLLWPSRTTWPRRARPEPGPGQVAAARGLPTMFRSAETGGQRIHRLEGGGMLLQLTRPNPGGNGAGSRARRVRRPALATFQRPAMPTPTSRRTRPRRPGQRRRRTAGKPISRRRLPGTSTHGRPMPGAPAHQTTTCGKARRQTPTCGTSVQHLGCATGLARRAATPTSAAGPTKTSAVPETRSTASCPATVPGGLARPSCPKPRLLSTAPAAR
mmetsp:Transcript_69323/g.196463  ORF Transcript_69323/g.196463 Transcript_69323/m.196463 type:complete len:266 (+) Transcript_69323:130-927(+)